MPADNAVVSVPRQGQEWQRLAGEFVEIHRAGELCRRGVVDAVMPDGTGLWLAAEGVQSRVFIWEEEGLTVVRVCGGPANHGTDLSKRSHTPGGQA